MAIFITLIGDGGDGGNNEGEGLDPNGNGNDSKPPGNKNDQKLPGPGDRGENRPGIMRNPPKNIDFPGNTTINPTTPRSSNVRLVSPDSGGMVAL